MSKAPIPVQHHITSTSNEWYTPARYVQAARDTMGGIDLDPASCEVANRVVRATRYYTKEQNGLLLSWSGRVWLNPPYGRIGHRSNQDLWSSRLIEQYERGNVTQAVLLVNANFDTRWFQALWSYPICFVNHRIDFWSLSSTMSGATHGSVIVYFGSDVERFASSFSSLGTIVVAPYRPQTYQPGLEEDRKERT